ncbi:hypothetical protein [Aromatoleum aromaticum]|uniref:Type II secretion system protein GspC N-terminal domain-containing protein n=1 Tax=Aromatoleum aromaticum (strain DSM 19018 / LMG 30748 / EbN1) TaxID=76114 RepID=Q5P6R3_AROAE|nr:hypothetical protein [Aromatoleum aromaticum]NMG53966.1 hypothetical protein [Aromatoleum aromaticum]CAI06998.1 hypothetical protein ebA1607 [Aromatoleum aromaticum EbN1]
MKRTTFSVLLGIDAVLLAVVGAVWAAGDTSWTPPPAQRPDPSSLQTEKIEREITDLVALSQTLDRPVFAQTRRPPPPPEVVAVETPQAPDPLEDVLLLGIFTVGKDKHLMLRADNKVSRLKQGDSFGPWTVGALDGNQASFIQGEQRRLLTLKHAAQPQATRLSAPVLPGKGGASVADGAQPAVADSGKPSPEPSARVAPAAAPAPPGAASSMAKRGGGSLAQRLAKRRAARLGLEKK